MSLFTGDTMLMPVAVAQKKTTWQKVFQSWLWVYAGNFIGVIFWAYLQSVGPFSKAGTTELTVFGENAMPSLRPKRCPIWPRGLQD
jgi:formate/nitrite transporter FocA (FNT family)